MFFSITQKKDIRFLNHQSLGDFYFNHDDGWEINKNSFFKGYKTPNISHGSWTNVHLINNGEIKISHDELRSYPLWWDDDSKILTNLDGKGESIWADTKVAIDKQKNLIKSNVDLVDSSYESIITVDEFSEWVIDNLSQKLNDFNLKYGEEILNFFPTGGIDTTTLFALLKYNNACQNINMLFNEYFYYDDFCNKNVETIRKLHWAYNQTHHWKDRSFLLSGAYGDEFWFRGPYIISLWAAWHDLDLFALLRKRNGYHVGYYLKEKNIKVFQKSFSERYQIQEMYPTYESLKSQILNINANDHQHWHLNNTLHWTPFKDLEITNKILSLPFDDILDHIIDANLNKIVIEKMSPDVIKIISQTKNVNSRDHLWKLI